MKLKAFAKVNLSLDIVRKREDGYHELEMVMVPIGVFDMLSIEKAHHDSFTCNKSYVFSNPDNTISKTINIIREKYNIKTHVKVELKKVIPTRAGLAGGSADAAAVIKLMDRLFNLNISDEEAFEICEMIGSDVWFTYYNKPALVKGKGDVLEPIEHNLKYHIVLVKPNEGVSTKKCFENLKYESLYHPTATNVVKSLKEADYDLFVKSIGNSMEESAFEITPKVKLIKDEMEKFNLDKVIMSGSGSTLFGVTRDINEANKVMNYFRAKKLFSIVTEVINV